MFKNQKRKDLSPWLIHFIHDSTTQHLPKDLKPSEIPDFIEENLDEIENEDNKEINLLDEYAKIFDLYCKGIPQRKDPDEEDKFLTELQNFYSLLNYSLNKQTNYFCRTVGWKEINVYEKSTAFENLKNIIKNGFIKSTWSFRKGIPTVYGMKSVVCFTEMPLYALLDYVKSRNNDKNVSPYGIFFLKTEAFKAKARPVIYGLTGEHKEKNDGFIRILDDECGISLNEQYRYVELNLNRKPYPIDWTFEREWRWGDIDNFGVLNDIPGFPLFPFEDEDYHFTQLYFLVKTNNEANEIIDLLRKQYDAECNDYYQFDVDIIKNCQVISLENITNELLNNKYLTIDEIPKIKFTPVTFENTDNVDVNKIETELLQADKIYTAYDQNLKKTNQDGGPCGLGLVATKESNTPLTRYLINNGKVYTDSEGNYILTHMGSSSFQSVELNYLSASEAARYLTKALGQKFYPLKYYD